VEALEPDQVILADGTSVAPEAIIAATGFTTDLDGLVGHLGVLDECGKPRGGFASHIGDGMFAIGYGIPPNGPLHDPPPCHAPGPSDRRLPSENVLHHHQPADGASRGLTLPVIRFVRAKVLPLNGLHRGPAGRSVCML
jgi:hypothetical protein